MEIKELNIHISRNFRKWKQFVELNHIQNFAPSEVDQIEKTFIWVEGDDVAATGSIAGNVLKYIAVCGKYSDGGAMFNQVVSHLITQAAMLGRYHLFVFTKPQYSQSFQYVGFKELALSNDGAILETGPGGIADYLATIPVADDGEQVAAIVMNANPFTKGHQYIVETASRENDHVYVFVLQDDSSIFTYQERFELVKQGTAKFKNVTVVPSGEYMISAATFPAYFLKDDQDQGHYQAVLDVSLFKRNIVPALHIKKRYVGTEPFSKTTDSYNQAMHEVLPPEVAVVTVPRLELGGEVISATKVRQAIVTQDVAYLDQVLPATTRTFVKAHLAELGKRIEQKGWK